MIITDNKLNKYSHFDVFVVNIAYIVGAGNIAIGLSNLWKTIHLVGAASLSYVYWPMGWYADPSVFNSNGDNIICKRNMNDELALVSGYLMIVQFCLFRQ